MKNTIMIKKNYEFKNLFSKGKFYYGEFIYMYIKKTNSSYNKFGIAISKKQGKAVKRNRLKRLIREMNLSDRIEVIDGGYNTDEYFDKCASMANEKEGGARCSECFRLRLDKTARYAKENNFDIK